MFGGQEEDWSQYKRSLDNAYCFSLGLAISSALGLGTVMLCTLDSYGLTFSVSSTLVAQGHGIEGDVMLTFFSVGTSSIGTARPAYQSLSSVRNAALRLSDVIERKSPTNSLDDRKTITPSLPSSHHIPFENVDSSHAKTTTGGDESAFILDDLSLDLSVVSSEVFDKKSGCGLAVLIFAN